MDLILQRLEYKEDGIISELKDESGKHIAYTLEHSYDSKPKLNNGTHACVRGIHRLHDGIPFETFEITGVPGHTGILIHAGNFNADSDGCCLIGASYTTSNQGTMVTASKATFAHFMNMMNGVDQFNLSVQG